MTVASEAPAIAPLLVVEEPLPGTAWQRHFQALWPAYRRWFLARQRSEPPSLAASRAQLARYMPELMPVWERLVALVREAGCGDLAARFLTLYRPPPFLTGCSLLATSDPLAAEPVLVRNYDYDPDLWDGVAWRSSWNGRATVALNDCLWGALDGINEHGLAVALAFGGRRVVGDGFGVPLIVRYLLETCTDVDQAQRALERLPSHMAYNLLLLDAEGQSLRAELAPDHATRFSDACWVTNHQGEGGHWPAYERASATHERAAALQTLSAASNGSDLAAPFLHPPLFASDFERSFATLYTAVWRPSARSSTVIVRGRQPVQIAV